MTKVRFIEDFDYKPTPSVTVAYQAGMIETVKRDCADLAIAAKKAVRVSGAEAEKTGDDDALGG